MESPQSSPTYYTTSRVLKNMPHLAELLGATINYAAPRWSRGVTCPAEGVLAWGYKPSAAKAQKLAVKTGLPLVRLEDAFLRSVKLGFESPPLGLVVDHRGMYYDPNSGSDLFALIPQALTSKQTARAEALIEQWRTARVSKYNHCRSLRVDYSAPFVLVVDQTYGDASITRGGADAERFNVMLQDAKARYPDHNVVIKTHPDVISGTKQGHFDPSVLKSDPQIILEGRSIHPPDLLERADAVFCVTSQMGFEGLLWGKPVYTFGMPFYAGWGLTQDYLDTPASRCAVSLAQLVHAALVGYARYWHPELQQACEVESLIEWIARQRDYRCAFPTQLLAERFPRWKKPYIEQYLDGTDLTFLPRHAEPPENTPYVGWGRKAQVARISVEDGFIRSVGLGADLTAPKSWVIDDLGMYYDATRPSRLEHILEHTTFSESELARAQALQHRLVQEQVSKYNVGDDTWQRPKLSNRVILVPGQVESDASIQFGSPHLKANIELLEAVRARNPSAYLVYKPHPDVVAGLRKADRARQRLYTLCDAVILTDNMATLLSKVDEVHTMTSLTGFEALLRDIPVTCYGQPFYAGWGLTSDIYPPQRRTQKRTLVELIAATLIRYPRYLSRKSGAICEVEQALDEIAEERIWAQDASHWASLQIKLKRILLRIKRF
ncbi:capsular polysaccharide export protein [Idiomarina fontislapidosi]|nr:capsular polysaccharide biosynthesis protein [Idiomarina fontislapidosi]PYE32827.1 capsular polysaccharide export protein [Idiomarina fontislapidosi]